MTNYSTETEAESYEAADLARIALQAAIDAVDAYQARNGVCDAPFRVSLSVDNGNEADRDVSAPEVYTGSAPSLREALDRIVPTDVQKHDDGWTRHDGGECPVHPMDVVQLKQGTDYVLENEHGVPANYFRWGPVSHYRIIRDEDGVPYCSAEGLEDWAEYVATDPNGGCEQYKSKPEKCDDEYPPHWYLLERRRAPACFANTGEHWTETLRRVYRREDT